MRLLIQLLFFLSLTFPCLVYAQANSIDGEWEASQGYAITIKHGDAKLSNLGKTKFPTKLLGDLFYGDIKHLEGNVWSAIRYQWKYLGSDVENGRWVNEGSVKFTLSSDNNSLSEGQRIFKRKLTTSEIGEKLSPNSKTELISDYAGVVVKYTVAKTHLGTVIVYFQAENTNTSVISTIDIVSNGASVVKQKLNPLERATGTISATSFSVNVSFAEYQNSSSQDVDIIKLISNTMRQLISVDGEEIKAKRKIETLAGGARG